MNKNWLREILELLDRAKQPTLIENMYEMKITQRDSQCVSLRLRHNERCVANRVVIQPMKKYSDLYYTEFWLNNLPTSSCRKLTIDEVKLLINKYTILELV